MLNLKYNLFLVECFKDFLESQEENKEYDISDAELIDFEEKPDYKRLLVKKVKDKIIIEFLK